MRVVIGLFLLSACFSMQPETLSIAYAAEHPGPYLTGVDTVAYHGILEPGIGNCKVDWEAWNTSIDFVANQSTKLKLLTGSGEPPSDDYWVKRALPLAGCVLS